MANQAPAFLRDEEVEASAVPERRPWKAGGWLMVWNAVLIPGEVLVRGNAAFGPGRDPVSRAVAMFLAIGFAIGLFIGSNGTRWAVLLLAGFGAAYLSYEVYLPGWPFPETRLATYVACVLMFVAWVLLLGSRQTFITVSCGIGAYFASQGLLLHAFSGGAR